MIYVIGGIVILALLSQALSIPIIFPSILWGLVPLATPIVVQLILKITVIKPAERKVERKRYAIEKKYAVALKEAQAQDEKNHEINNRYKKEQAQKEAERVREQKQQIVAELDFHKARLREINVIGTNEKTVSYLQKLIEYMESMRADSIKEAINLAVSEKRIIDNEMVKAFQESLQASENRRIQEEMLDEARRVRRAEEARVAEAKKTSDAVDKIKRDLEYEMTYGKRP